MTLTVICNMLINTELINMTIDAYFTMAIPLFCFLYVMVNGNDEAKYSSITILFDYFQDWSAYQSKCVTEREMKKTGIILMLQ